MTTTETLKTRATLPTPRSRAARARRLRTVTRLGFLDGADDVAERVAEDGEETVAAWPVAGWDEAAINAGVAQIRLGVLAKDEGCAPRTTRATSVAPTRRTGPCASNQAALPPRRNDDPGARSHRGGVMSLMHGDMDENPGTPDEEESDEKKPRLNKKQRTAATAVTRAQEVTKGLEGLIDSPVFSAKCRGWVVGRHSPAPCWAIIVTVHTGTMVYEFERMPADIAKDDNCFGLCQDDHRMWISGVMYESKQNAPLPIREIGAGAFNIIRDFVIKTFRAIQEQGSVE